MAMSKCPKWKYWRPKVEAPSSAKIITGTDLKAYYINDFHRLMGHSRCSPVLELAVLPIASVAGLSLLPGHWGRLLKKRHGPYGSSKKFVMERSLCGRGNREGPGLRSVPALSESP
jgi:hypothetical protein